MLVNVGKGIELNVDTKRLNKEVMDHVVYMGLRNILMDAHASHTKEEIDYLPQSRAASEAKLASMYAGEVRAVGTRSTDPVAVQMRALAGEHVRAALRAHCRKNGKKMGDFSPEKIREAVIKYLAKNEASLRETAQEMVTTAKSAEINLEGIEI